MLAIILTICAFINVPLFVAAINFTTRLTTYNDTIVRNLFYPLSAAAYGNTPGKCFRELFKSGQVVQTSKVQCVPGNKTHECFGYVAYAPQEKIIVLGFRGSKSSSQIEEEKRWTKSKTLVKFPFGGYVNPYFYKAFTNLMKGGLDRALQEITKKYRNAALWITGHSLGGSMAALAAGHIVQNNYVKPKDITLVTFGQPRTGDALFAKNMDKTIINSWRVNHKHDIVPNIIPVNLHNFVYQHHNREIWYNNDMKPGQSYTVCRPGDDLYCIRSVDPKLLNWVDHVTYFGKAAGFATAGCSKKFYNVRLYLLGQ
uniref:Lipase_3 domain-containing protein n=1 Tax=Panagrellus redivivus TaxID=6233 RepID=A0A7E4VYN5_PANRE